MVVVEPTPRGDATVVIMHYPLQAFSILEYQGSHFHWIVVRYIQLPLFTEGW